ncbi:MAG: polysaccharide deacetylase family protein [Chloroflexota bacterium]
MLSPRFAWQLSVAALFLLVLAVLAGCGDNPATPTAIVPTATVPPSDTATPIVPPTETQPPIPTSTSTPEATATPLFVPIPESERGFVPILCYHHIRDWVASDTEDDRAYIVPPAKLDAQLSWLKENGYTTVTSEQVYEYVKNGKPLPVKPIMLSFDDNDDNQYTNAMPLLKKYGMTATFFIMTVTLDKENYMTSEQVKELDQAGFDVQPHTWDHHMVTGYTTDDDWQQQLVEPKKTLEDLLGHPTPFFAYPFGIYDATAATKLAEFGYKGAFRLVEIMDDTVPREYAIERRITNGYWTADQFATVVEGGWE